MLKSVKGYSRGLSLKLSGRYELQIRFMSHPEVNIVEARTAKRTLSWEETPERRLF